jgi:hypothetical protein
MTVGAFEEELFGQHFLVCPFARRDCVFRIDTDIWPAACVDTDPTSCTQRLAFLRGGRMGHEHRRGDSDG